jgi:pimeloyl-ACP methyl ester carboxylesterase
MNGRPARGTSPFARLGEGWRRHVDPAWLEDWNPVRFELEGGATEVVTLGSGPPLVLLPPLPGYKEGWLACARPLARSFRIVTFDLRVRFAGPPRWQALIEDLERILDALAPGPVAVVGHSLGGALAQRWALARPDRVRALVLSSSFPRVRTPPGQWRARYVAQPLVVASQRFLPRHSALALARRLAATESWVYDRSCDDHLLDFVRFCIRDLPLAAGRDCIRLALAHDTRAEIASLRVPTLLIVGEKDTAFAREAAQDLAAQIPGATLVVSPGVGHLHPLSGAAWLSRTITEWLCAATSR